MDSSYLPSGTSRKPDWKKICAAFFILSGTVIGASFLALPYIALNSGLALTVFYLFALTIIVALIHYFYAEVVIETSDFMRLPSYARIYLGRAGKMVALGSTFIGFLGSLLAYIIIGAGFLENFFAPFFDGSQLFYAFAFFIFGALIVFFGKKAVSGVDFLDVFLFIFVLAAILIFGWQSWDLANLSAKTISVSNGLGRFYTIFLPYGVILSALWGATVIPEMEELLGENKRKLRKIVPLGVIIPAIFYLLFIIIAFGISGNTTTAEAISGLKAHLPVFVSSFLFFFGIVVVFTSYVSIGLALRNSLRYDLGINKKIAWLIACFAPFFFYLIGFRNFIKVMGFVGAVALAIEGILIILMYNKVKKRKWGTLPLILILLAGMALEIIYFLK